MSSDQDKTVIIDIQFVTGNYNQVFAKEVVILFANSISPDQYLFKNPYSYLELNEKAIKQCRFVHDNINGLNWSDGHIEYTQLKDILENIKDFTIIVKGIQKQQFIKKFLSCSNILDLNIGCSLKKLKKFQHNCEIHDPNYERCAINNVFKILFYLERNNFFINKMI